MGQSRSSLMNGMETTWRKCTRPDFEQEEKTIWNEKINDGFPSKSNKSSQMLDTPLEINQKCCIVTKRHTTNKNLPKDQKQTKGREVPSPSEINSKNNDDSKCKKQGPIPKEVHEISDEKAVKAAEISSKATKPRVAKENNDSSSALLAGSTILRANPCESITRMIQEFGPNSSKVVRAYSSIDTSKVEPPFAPLPHSYWNTDASLFHLRSGQNYKKNKQKSPSAPALYDLYSFDFIELPHTLKNVEDKFRRPDIPGITDKGTGHPDVPPMFVVLGNIPKVEPKMMGDPVDGHSFVAVYYFVISEATLEALKDLDNASPAVKLFVQFCQRAEMDDEFRGRFKAMAILDDVQKLGLPSFITGYNGKPVLINKSGKLKRHSNYMELSINIFMFNYIAKKGLHSLKPKFSSFVLNVGFTIEARSDSELPEVLLGGCRLINLDLEKATKC